MGVDDGLVLVKLPALVLEARLSLLVLEWPKEIDALLLRRLLGVARRGGHPAACVILVKLATLVIEASLQIVVLHDIGRPQTSRCEAKFGGVANRVARSQLGPGANIRDLFSPKSILV